MRTSIRKSFGIAGLLAAASALAPVVATGQLPGGVLPARVLGDRILVRAALQTETWYKDTHVVIDFARPTALEMHGNVFSTLTWGEGDENLEIFADGFRMEVPREAVIEEIGALLGPITSRYDNELEQIDVAAILGWGVLKDYAFRLNLQEGEIALTPALQADSDEARSRAAIFVDGVETFDNRVLIPLTWGGGRPGWLEFDTAGYHTWIDRPLAASVGEPYGEIDDIRVGAAADAPGETLSGIAAFFPQDFRALRETEFVEAKAVEDSIRPQAEAAGVPVPPQFLARPIVEFNGDVLLRSGLSLLSAYEWELNHVLGYVTLTRLVDSNRSEADARFYAAAADRDATALHGYLDGWPADRNVEEAARLLFDLGLESGASAEEQLRVIDYGLAVNEDRRHMEYAMGFLAGLKAPGTMVGFLLGVDPAEGGDDHSELIVAVCNRAMEFVARSQAPAMRQHIQLVLADRRLARGDAHEAWKFALAAAFNGDPGLDGITRHELGRAYEGLGRLRRAYSSYERALSEFVGLTPEMTENATAALERLRPQLDADDPLLGGYEFTADPAGDSDDG